MELRTGYLWKTTGPWEQDFEGEGIEKQVQRGKLLVFHEDGGGGAYVLTADNEIPLILWGEIEEYIPERTRSTLDLPVLDCDGACSVWVVKADGKTNEVTVLVD